MTTANVALTRTATIVDELEQIHHRISERGAEQGTIHLCEFSHGQLFRPIHFPEPIDPEKVAAEYQNAVLMVSAPIAQADVTTKAAKSRARR